MMPMSIRNSRVAGKFAISMAFVLHDWRMLRRHREDEKP
jgi:hypothetical protein